MIVLFESLGPNEMVRSISPAKQKETVGLFGPVEPNETVVPSLLGEPIKKLVASENKEP